MQNSGGAIALLIMILIAGAVLLVPLREALNFRKTPYPFRRRGRNEGLAGERLNGLRFPRSCADDLRGA